MGVKATFEKYWDNTGNKYGYNNNQQSHGGDTCIGG
jgi:hypothetical protein